jgi:alpha-glucuronidase
LQVLSSAPQENTEGGGRDRERRHSGLKVWGAFCYCHKQKKRKKKKERKRKTFNYSKD